MNYLVAIHFVMANCLLPTNTNVEFEMDFVHSFLVKADKLRKTARLDNAEDRWIKKTGYKVTDKKLKKFTLLIHFG